MYRLTLTASDTTEVNVSALWAPDLATPPVVRNNVLKASHSAGDRTREVFTAPAPKGFLYRMGTGTPGGVKRGQIYGEIGLGMRGGGGLSLSAGYISEAMGLKPGYIQHPTEGPGLIVDNEAASTLVNNTALTRTIAVPTNARWLWYGGGVFNADNVTRNVKVRADDGTLNQDIVRWHRQDVATVVRIAYPNTHADDEMGGAQGPQPLKEADRIVITFEAGGASAGGTARSSALVEEWVEQ